MRRLFVMLFIVALAIPAFAAAPPQGTGRPCTLAGAWYGGSDPAYPFHWTFTPAGPGRYTYVTWMGVDFRPAGYTSWTDWTGEAVSTDPTTLESWGMSMYVMDADTASAFGVDPALPELDIVQSRIDMIDCDTFTSTVEVYAGYFGWTAAIEPFTDPYDASFLPDGATVVETYHRMRTSPDFTPQHSMLREVRTTANGPVRLLPRRR